MYISSIIVNYYNCKWWSESIYTTFVRCDKCQAAVDVHSQSQRSLCRVNSICHSPVLTKDRRWIGNEDDMQIMFYFFPIKLHSDQVQPPTHLSPKHASTVLFLYPAQIISSKSSTWIFFFLCHRMHSLFAGKKRRKKLIFKWRSSYFHSINVSLHFTLR